MYQSPKTPFGDTTKAVIAHHFGRWTAYSALRLPGKYVKKKERVLEGLDAICFTPIFDDDRSKIDEYEFDTWHKDAVEIMCRGVSPTADEQFHVGHAAKAIAVYLKTVCYLSGYGRRGLARVIHPPFDQASMKVMGIDGNVFPDRHCYEDHEGRVSKARCVGKEKGCSPIELEELWRPD